MPAKDPRNYFACPSREECRFAWTTFRCTVSFARKKRCVLGLCDLCATRAAIFNQGVQRCKSTRGGGKGLKTAGKTSLNSTSLQLVFLPQPWSRCVPLGRASCDPSLRLSAPPSARGWSTRLGGLEARLGERVNDTPCNFYRDSRNCWTFPVEFLNNDCD